jgi:hypothetical protein
MQPRNRRWRHAKPAALPPLNPTMPRSCCAGSDRADHPPLAFRLLQCSVGGAQWIVPCSTSSRQRLSQCRNLRVHHLPHRCAYGRLARHHTFHLRRRSARTFLTRPKQIDTVQLEHLDPIEDALGHVRERGRCVTLPDQRLLGEQATGICISIESIPELLRCTFHELSKTTRTRNVRGRRRLAVVANPNPTFARAARAPNPWTVPASWRSTPLHRGNNDIRPAPGVVRGEYHVHPHQRRQIAAIPGG